MIHRQGEVQPGEQLLQNTLDVWKGPSMIITGDDDPTVPTQVLHSPSKSESDASYAPRDFLGAACARLRW